MVTDTRLFYLELSADSVGSLKFTALSFFHDAGFIAQQGDGWTPVSHTLTSTGDGNFLLSVMATRVIGE